MPYLSVSLADLQGSLAAAWDGSAFWTAEEARLALNETLRLWNLLTGAWRRRFVIPTLANTPYYTMPVGSLVPLYVNWQEQPLDPSALADLNLGRSNWRRETIATSGCPTRPSIFVPLGFRTFAIWPSDTVATRTLALDAVIAAPTLVQGADRVDLNDADLGVIVGMALRLVAFKEPGVQFAQLVVKERAFYQAAAVQSAAFRASAVYRALLGQDRSRWFRPHLRPLDPDLAALLDDVPGASAPTPPAALPDLEGP